MTSANRALCPPTQSSCKPLCAVGEVAGGPDQIHVPDEECGRRVWRDMEEFNTLDGGVHAYQPDRSLMKIVDGYLAKTENRGGRVGDARPYLFRARKLQDFALAVMKAVVTDAPGAIAPGSICVI